MRVSHRQKVTPWRQDLILREQSSSAFESDPIDRSGLLQQDVAKRPQRLRLRRGAKCCHPIRAAPPTAQVPWEPRGQAAHCKRRRRVFALTRCSRQRAVTALAVALNGRHSTGRSAKEHVCALHAARRACAHVQNVLRPHTSLSPLRCCETRLGVQRRQSGCSQRLRPFADDAAPRSPSRQRRGAQLISCAWTTTCVCLPNAPSETFALGVHGLIHPRWLLPICIKTWNRCLTS